ncbi:hypothetical protein O181_083632 [Austropuccinia psidii MF-1]|uniref:Uncharacterized protein n=1 Tax=Austropuccinia psidii MF-1 TaxID=1389203 RepID=A0A9Q3FUS7_9BASI|nr:hypothetical protein [Austropuccinia psidii MF-1]
MIEEEEENELNFPKPNNTPPQTMTEELPTKYLETLQDSDSIPNSKTTPGRQGWDIKLTFNKGHKLFSEYLHKSNILETKQQEYMVNISHNFPNSNTWNDTINLLYKEAWLLF